MNNIEVNDIVCLIVFLLIVALIVLAPWIGEAARKKAVTSTTTTTTITIKLEDLTKLFESGETIDIKINGGV